MRAGLDRRTVRRWREWVVSCTPSFAFFLRSRFPELGRAGDDWQAFWRACLQQMPLCEAMAWLDRELTVP